MINMNTKISARILVLVQTGMSPKEAFDEVLGAGAFVKLAHDIHEKLTKEG